MKGRQPCIHGNLCRAIYNLTGCIYSVRCPYECEFYEPVKKVTSEWIPGSNSLPEYYNELVLVTVKGKHNNITFENAIELAFYDKDEGWILGAEPDWLDPNVTAWMPLPKPYKQVSRNDEKEHVSTVQRKTYERGR